VVSCVLRIAEFFVQTKKKNLKKVFLSFSVNFFSCPKQAAIIIVYAFGLLTLMARNLDEDNEEENKLANNIVSYFPILPSMQVTHYSYFYISV
jgi:hypothetical protein